jgi:DNA replicative helicase MCM subunit Mcm2 (Cdc46/Mcm family)
MNFDILNKVFQKISVQENSPVKYGVRQVNRLFDPVIGFDDIKEILQLSINADKPVHILLVGPPASAKSLFMSCLTKLERSYYAVGSSSTKSGIFDYLFEHRPRYFIIDEIEKMSKRDQASLLGLMESGLLSELKHRQQRMTQLKTWVFASANDADKLLAPLLTRFTVIHLKPYTKEEFVEIAINILNRDESIEKEMARFIAELVFDNMSSNMRECIRIARLADNNIAKVQRVVNMLTTYGNRGVKL